MNLHPMMEDDNRPKVATKPIESLGDAILIALEDGYRGIQILGRSGDGKSYASSYLSTHLQWLKQPAPTCWVSIPRRTNGSDNVFYKVIQGALKLSYHPGSAAIDRLGQIVSRISSDCQRAGSRRFILFIDEAQRLSVDDYDYLANIDDAVGVDGFRLLCVLVNQSDDAKAFGKKWEARVNGMPPHVIRRFFMAEHTFRGLEGLSEIAHALSRYDTAEHLGVTFSAFFGPGAYAVGWRLASEASKFVAALNEIRQEAQLAGLSDLPMMIFELAVKRLLVNVAGCKDTFKEFTQGEIKEAILRAGYLKLEASRQRQGRP
jgi:hypothetical protein